MRLRLATLLAIYIAINIITYTYCYVTMPQQEFTIRGILINKINQEATHQYKHYTEVKGFNKIFIVNTKEYGYLEIPVTINTYMTTNVGDSIIFDKVSRTGINQYAGRCIYENSLLHDYFFIFLFFTIGLLGLMLIIWLLSDTKDYDY